MAAPDGARLRGIVVVPVAPRAKWWGLVRHFQVEGWFMAGGRHLEMNMLGTWASTRSARPSLLLSFPSGAGTAAPIQSSPGQCVEYLEAMGGYVGAAGVEGVCRPVPSGALLYAPGAEREGARGSLYLVHGGSDPRDPGSNGEESDGVWFVGVAELLARGDGSREYALSYDINTRARVEKGSHREALPRDPSGAYGR